MNFVDFFVLILQNCTNVDTFAGQSKSILVCNRWSWFLYKPSLISENAAIRSVGYLMYLLMVIQRHFLFCFRNGKLVQMCHFTGLPDDCTVGFLSGIYACSINVLDLCVFNKT